MLRAPRLNKSPKYMPIAPFLQIPPTPYYMQFPMYNIGSPRLKAVIIVQS